VAQASIFDALGRESMDASPTSTNADSLSDAHYRLCDRFVTAQDWNLVFADRIRHPQ
jgi:hypothetical protein